MKKLFYFAIALSLLCTNFTQAQQTDSDTANFKKWQVRLRGVSVMPDESATISTISGDISISDSFIPEVDFTYFSPKILPPN